MLSIKPMHCENELDQMSNASALKVVNDENDVTPVTPFDEKQGGIFASIKAVFGVGMFSTDVKRPEGAKSLLEDSVVIEKKSSEEDDKASDMDKKEADLGNSSVLSQLKDSLPQTEICENIAY